MDGSGELSLWTLDTCAAVTLPSDEGATVKKTQLTVCSVHQCRLQRSSRMIDDFVEVTFPLVNLNDIGGTFRV